LGKAQWILVSVAILVGASLYFLGRTTTKEKEASVNATTVAKTTTIDFKAIEATFIQKNEVPDTLKIILEQYKNNPKDTNVLLDLALAYRSMHQAHLAGHYFYELAEVQNNPIYYERAGNAFLNAQRENIDTSISDNLLTFAVQSLEKAIAIEPNSVSAKMLLGTAYVESGLEPMKGVGLLKEVADADPNNLEAQILLGRFSLQSGQYDKAKERLDAVLKKEPNNTEAIYFLAFTEAELGNKKRALELIELCKSLVNNPDFDKEIEHFVKELKK